MDPTTVYIPNPTPALSCAAEALNDRGIPLAHCCEDADCLLYPAPTPLNSLCDYLIGKTVIGGNLDFLKPEVERFDLLKDPFYLAANAAITAEAALGLILNHMKCAITEAEILILGWGRIGKCLTHQLKALNTHLTVYARKGSDQALLKALSYRPITLEQLREELPRFRCIVNTIPAPVLTAADMACVSASCFKMDLASVLSLPGDGVLHARGLPGRCKPEASGALIAETVARYLKGGK